MFAYIEIIFLFVLSFLPPIIYSIWIRNTERCHREQWAGIAMAFLWGATLAVVFSLILEILFNIPIALSTNAGMASFLAVVVVAPVVEEFAKPFALRLKSVKPHIDELEDGLIYGAVAGLGFSATENLFYGADALSINFVTFLVLISLRSVGASLLHASATALTGYGYGKTILGHTSIVRMLPYFLLAIFAHAFYNFVVSYELIGAGLGLLIAFVFVFFMIWWVRKKIRALDALTC